ncbi:MAG: DUF6763 family protein [Steroidobacterales bacterium]
MNSTAGPPLIGSWYRHLDKGDLFQVVGFDEHSHTIEIQVVDGDIDEIDEDVWDTLPIAQAEPPEDPAGAIDDMDSDAASDLDSEARPAPWSEPLELERLQARDDSRDDEARAVADDGAAPFGISGDGKAASAKTEPHARQARSPTVTSRSWPRRQRVRPRPKNR